MRRLPRMRRSGRQPDAEEMSLWRDVVRDVNPIKRAQSKRKPTVRAAETQKQPALVAHASAPRPQIPESRPPAAPQRMGSGVDGATAKRLRQGQISPDATLDLHGMTQDRAHAALDRFLMQSVAAAHQCVLIVTGVGRSKSSHDHAQAPWSRDGRGVLRTLVPLWLESGPHHARIAKLSPAHVRHGGQGAFYVYLKTKQTRT